jgi:hypothetical protein
VEKKGIVIKRKIFIFVKKKEITELVFNVCLHNCLAEFTGKISVSFSHRNSTPMAIKATRNLKNIRHPLT